MKTDFHQKYERVTESGCWIWTGYVDKWGYGINRGFPVGTRRLAHRCSYEMARGPIPDGMLVCHSCDVPACVNPNHLFLGTPADNSADKVSKRRHLYGENTPAAKLNASQVTAIRGATGSQRKIAKAFGVTDMTVWKIRTGKTWKHIPDPEGTL